MENNDVTRKILGMALVDINRIKVAKTYLKEQPNAHRKWLKLNNMEQALKDIIKRVRQLEIQNKQIEVY